MDTSNRIKEMRPPTKVFPPGDTILEILELRGLTPDDLALSLNWERDRLDLLLNGAVLTPQVALELERIFDIEASFWNNLESNYRRYYREIFQARVVSIFEGQKRWSLALSIVYGLTSFLQVVLSLRSALPASSGGLGNPSEDVDLVLGTMVLASFFAALSADYWCEFRNFQAGTLGAKRDLKTARDLFFEWLT